MSKMENVTHNFEVKMGWKLIELLNYFYGVIFEAEKQRQYWYQWTVKSKKKCEVKNQRLLKQWSNENTDCAIVITGVLMYFSLELLL